MIQLFSNSLGDKELSAIKKVFKSKWLGFGKETQTFQENLGKRIGSPNVLCVNCATAAAYMAMKILDIKKGDEVIIPSINFAGCSNAIIDSGAKPVFADVDTRYLNIIPEEIERLRTPKTKAVLILHYGGHPCDMSGIFQHSKGLKIIEDSACALVSKYKKKNCGTLGDIGFFSFDGMKILSVGDGGAIVINDAKLIDKAKEIRYMGISNRQSGIDSYKDGKKRWWEIELNNTSNRFTPNDISSAIGNVQLKKLDYFIVRRKEIWTIYQKEFSGIQNLIIPPEPLPNTKSSYYFYWLTIPEKRDELAHYLVSNGIYCTFRYYPLHLIKYYKYKGSLKNSEKVNNDVLNIPIHQNLTDNDVDKIINTVKKFIKKFL